VWISEVEFSTEYFSPANGSGVPVRLPCNLAGGLRAWETPPCWCHIDRSPPVETCQLQALQALELDKGSLSPFVYFPFSVLLLLF
jgi:hypothetical protein